MEKRGFYVIINGRKKNKTYYPLFERKQLVENAVNTCVPLALTYDWDNLILAAKNGKRCMIKVTGIQGERKDEFFVEIFKIYILD